MTGIVTYTLKGVDMNNLSLFKEMLWQELELQRNHQDKQRALRNVCLRLHIDPTNEGIRDYLTKGTISQQEGVIQ